jgi:hypothetical protein
VIVHHACHRCSRASGVSARAAARIRRLPELLRVVAAEERRGRGGPPERTSRPMAP